MVDINEIAGLRKRLEALEAYLPMLEAIANYPAPATAAVQNQDDGGNDAQPEAPAPVEHKPGHKRHR